MLSPPAKHDSDPGDVVVWQAYVAEDNRKLTIPPHIIVTSGACSRNGTKKHQHHALICHTDQSLDQTSGGRLNARQLRNIGGKIVGNSQVTAVVELEKTNKEKAIYNIDVRAELARPFFANMVEPRILTTQQRNLLDQMGKNRQATVDQWAAVVRAIR